MFVFCAANTECVQGRNDYFACCGCIPKGLGEFMELNKGCFLVNTALYDLLLDLLPDHRNLKLVLKDGVDHAKGHIVKSLGFQLE